MIPVSRPDLSGNEQRYISDAISSGWISSRGDYVNRFASEFARWAGNAHALPTNSGTSALHAALVGIGIERGDEVIVPALSYIATANAVTYCGATPVFADVDPETWTMDPASVEKLVNRRTRALLPVALFGVPADMDALQRIADRCGLWMVSDAAQAHGATWDGQPLATQADVSAYSFYGNKIMTTGEGGMVTTDDPLVHHAARRYAHQGQRGMYEHPSVGHNYRMTNLAAAIGLAQLERIDQLLADRAVSVLYYYDAGLDPAQYCDARGHRAWWQFPYRTPEPAKVVERLAKAGVESRPMFRPLHRQAHYSGQAPVAEALSRETMILPLYPAMSRDEVETVVTNL